MKRYIVIGVIAISIIVGLVEACVDGISNIYESITSTHEEVVEAIDKGNLSEAMELLPNAMEEERYKCALLLMEEYIAVENVDDAVYVFERITPEHCSMYEMKFESLYRTGKYTKEAATMLYPALIEKGKYEKAWKYHELEYEDPNYAGNAPCYYNFLLDVMDYLCEQGNIKDAEDFLNEHVVWFRQNVDRSSHAENFQQYSYRNVKARLQIALDKYKMGGTE
jgi:tetratricopeptide (TPR) repeat protein